MDILTRLRTGIIRGVTGIVITSTVTSMAMSYWGLHAWGAEHDTGIFWSYVFPGFIDAFPLGAEGVLMLAYIDHWRTRSRVALWFILTLGLVVSIGLNVGHIYRQSTDYWTWITNGLPPFATWLSLVVGTMAFKRAMAHRPRPAEDPETVEDELDDELEYVPVPTIGRDLQAAAAAFDDQIKAGKVPGLNRIRKTLNVGHSKAPIIQAHLRELASHQP